MFGAASQIEKKAGTKENIMRFLEILRSSKITLVNFLSVPPVAQDEFLELMNRLFAKFPKVRTLEGMGRLGNIPGATQRSKRCVNSFI